MHKGKAKCLVSFYLTLSERGDTRQDIMEVLSPNSLTETHLNDVINICENGRHINNHQHKDTEDEINTQKMLMEQIVKNQREKKFSKLERKHGGVDDGRK